MFMTPRTTTESPEVQRARVEEHKRAVALGYAAGVRAEGTDSADRLPHTAEKRRRRRKRRTDATSDSSSTYTGSSPARSPARQELRTPLGRALLSDMLSGESSSHAPRRKAAGGRPRSRSRSRGDSRDGDRLPSRTNAPSCAPALRMAEGGAEVRKESRSKSTAAGTLGAGRHDERRHEPEGATERDLFVRRSASLSLDDRVSERFPDTAPPPAEGGGSVAHAAARKLVVAARRESTLAPPKTSLLSSLLGGAKAAAAKPVTFFSFAPPRRKALSDGEQTPRPSSADEKEAGSRPGGARGGKARRSTVDTAHLSRVSRRADGRADSVTAGSFGRGAADESGSFSARAPRRKAHHSSLQADVEYAVRLKSRAELGRFLEENRRRAARRREAADAAQSLLTGGAGDDGIDARAGRDPEQAHHRLGPRGKARRARRESADSMADA